MLSDARRQLDQLSFKQQEVFDELNDPKRPSKLLDFYVRLIPRTLNAERCSIFIHDPISNKVWLKAGTGVTERGIEVSVKDSLVGRAIQNGEAVTDYDLQSRNGVHRSIDTTTGFITREVICVPIRSSSNGSKITGAIEVLNKKGAGKFSEDDREFLEEIGQHIQGVVENAYLCQEAIGMSKNLLATAGKMVFAGGLAIAASVFVSVVMAVYFGFPAWFAA